MDIRGSIIEIHFRSTDILVRRYPTRIIPRVRQVAFYWDLYIRSILDKIRFVCG
jgi:hypothetical protein